MPRVHTRTRKRAQVKRPMRCSAHPCKVAESRDGDTEIRVGDTYFTWARKMARGGIVYFRHAECGRPKMSELSSRKTVRIDEAVNEADWSFSPEVDSDGEYDGDFGQVSDAVTAIAEVAREVGEEYQESFDNLPENFQYGDTGQALEAVAQELDSWCDDLESWEPNVTWDQPERDEGESDDDYRDRAQNELDQWASDVVSDAQDAVGDHPEYEG